MSFNVSFTVSIARLIFDTIFRLLSLGNNQPRSKMWLPNWTFENAQDEAEAKILVDSCQVDLTSKGVLILGSQVNSESANIFTINDSLKCSIKKAMQKPENLDGWLTVLKDN